MYQDMRKHVDVFSYFNASVSNVGLKGFMTIVKRFTFNYMTGKQLNLSFPLHFNIFFSFSLATYLPSITSSIYLM